MRIYVLLFNANTENEGIHTIQMGDRHKILMFEDEDDAIRFALMLEAQDFPPATVESLDSQEIEDFCREVGYEWELIKTGMLAVPPEHNVEEKDWDLDGKRNNYPTPSYDDDSPSEMSQAELDRIRRQLEGLL